ncbi:hypothetical protein JRQ81_013028, partial [Phrynocephalus forsythii]
MPEAHAPCAHSTLIAFLRLFIKTDPPLHDIVTDILDPLGKLAHLPPVSWSIGCCGLCILLNILITMSSAEEETKTTSPESTEEEHWCVLKKVSDLPLVTSTYEKVSASYTSAKESHPAIQAVCDMAEVGVKAIATTAASGAQPLLDKFEPQIAAVDTIACQSLDKLQETLPVVQQAVQQVIFFVCFFVLFYARSGSDGFTFSPYITSQVVSGAKDLLTESLTPVYSRVTEAKDAVSSMVDLARETAHEHMEMAKSAVRNGVNTMMETSMGQMMAEGVDRMIFKSDELIEDYLPMTDDELAALAASVSLDDPEVAPLEKQKKEQGYYVRLGSLSAKLRTRAYYHSLLKVRMVKQAVQDALFQLGQVIALIKYTKKSMDQKVQVKLQRMWQEWIKGQPVPPCGANPLEMESQALKVSHHIVQKMQGSCWKLLSDMQGLPDALREKVQQAHRNMEKLQAALSQAKSFEEVPCNLLKQSQEKIDKAQEAVQEVMEYVSKNAPLTWVEPLQESWWNPRKKQKQLPKRNAFTRFKGSAPKLKVLTVDLVDSICSFLRIRDWDPEGSPPAWVKMQEADLIGKTLRSVLQSHKNGVPFSRLQEEYKSLTGVLIPFKQLGYSTLDEYLKSVPGVVRIEIGKAGEVICHAVVCQETAMIAQLVACQRNSKRKSGKQVKCRMRLKKTPLPASVGKPKGTLRKPEFVNLADESRKPSLPLPRSKGGYAVRPSMNPALYPLSPEFGVVGPKEVLIQGHMTVMNRPERRLVLPPRFQREIQVHFSKNLPLDLN